MSVCTMDADAYASLVYIVITAALAEVCRFPLNRYLDDNVVRRCCLEFVACFEFCAICYELGLVYQKCGLTEYGVLMFFAIMWWGFRWTVPGCPYCLVEDWLEENLDWLSVIAQMIFEILGGSLFYRFYLSYLWDLGYGNLHVEWLNKQECSSSITIDVWKAAIIEGVCTFVLRLLVRMLIYVNFSIALTINSLVNTLLVLAATTTTGGYFHPVLASTLQYGCTGTTLWEHVFVYWFASFVGAILAVLIWKIRAFRNIFRPKSD